MGIQGFYSWVKPKVAVKNVPRDVYSLSIDLNSLFHDSINIISGNNLDDGSKSNISDKEKERKKKNVMDFKQNVLKMRHEDFHESLFQRIIETIKAVINDVKPKKYIIIVIDGVSPLAKMSQQRKRRFYSDATSTNKIFNSNQISPGTPFMEDIEKRIKRWIDGYATECSIIFSPSTIHGEGEHKIFSIFREGLVGISNLVVDENVHVVYSKDSDMYLIGGLCQLENIFIYNDRRAEKGFYNDYEQKEEFKILSVVKFREYIRGILNCEYPIHCFSFLMTLIGNDFVPGLRMFQGHTSKTIYGNISGDLDKSVKILCDIVNENSIEIIQEDLSIRSSELVRFLSFLSDIEKNTIESITDSSPSHPERLMKKVKEKLLKKGKESDWFPTFSMEYYRISLGTKTGSDDIFPDENSIVCCSGNFIQMMYWIYYYYTVGESEINRNCYYVFNCSPLVGDLFQVARKMDSLKILSPVPLECLKNKERILLNIVHQHLIIFPYSSSSISCDEARSIFRSNALSGTFGPNIAVNSENSAYDYHVDILVPDFDLDFINSLIKRNVKPSRIAELNKDSKIIIKANTLEYKENIFFSPYVVSVEELSLASLPISFDISDLDIQVFDENP